MNLKELLSGIEKQVYGNEDIEIEGISYDSRKISNNYLFFALNGAHTNGIKFVKDAVSKGAVCIVSQEKVTDINCTNIVVKDIVSVMSEISAKFLRYF